MKLSEIYLKEIQMTQDIIKRMSTNSFFIKGGVLTLASASLIRDNSASNYSVFTDIATIFLIVLFWWLDAYYLRQERLYRVLMCWFTKHRDDSDHTHLFDFNTSRVNGVVESHVRVMKSSPLRELYILLLLMSTCKLCMDIEFCMIVKKLIRCLLSYA